MANQLNYASTITLSGEERPSRVSSIDLALLNPRESQVLFGTEPSDNIEVYIYNPDGSINSHVNLVPTYPNITLQTIVDNTGGFEYLDINLQELAKDISLLPGRYATTFNIFRDEVGSEFGYKLYISTISPSSTELRLQPVQVTSQTTQDMYDFLVPSVPPEFAQGLVEQIYGQSLDNTPGEFITQDFVDAFLAQIDSTIIPRIQNSNTTNSYDTLVQGILAQAYTTTLNILAANLPIDNGEIERAELESYVQTAIAETVQQFISSGVVDPHFSVT